jgi:hypothetical protein
LRPYWPRKGPEAYGEAQGAALYKSFHRDLDRIRQSLSIKLGADRGSGEYFIHDLDLPLLDLPNEDLATIAWLQQTFTPTSPHHQAVWSLLERLRFYLAPERRVKVEQNRTALVLELGQLDDDRLDPGVESGLSRALAHILSPVHNCGNSF